MSRLLSSAALLVLACRILFSAWVADDAYITFRVVDNLLGGYGLVWNPGERVQVYTHPLWLLLHVPLQMMTGNLYISTLLLSFACLSGAVWIAAPALGKPRRQGFFLLGLLLAVCKPVADFAASGLETPLAFLLIAWFYRLLRLPGGRFWLHISLASSLLMLTRLDFALLIAPAWLWLLFRRPRWRQVVAGGLPLAGWLMFSLLYYGFFLPNTKYAKLNAGVPQDELWAQGSYYLLDLLVSDALSASLLVSGIACGLTMRGRPAFLAMGALAYCIYIMAVGGDFMSGRFWAPPLFLVILLLAEKVPSSWLTLPRAAVLAVTAAAGALGSWQAHTGVLAAQCPGPAATAEEGSAPICSLRGIVDERAYYLPVTGLWSAGDWPRLRPQGELVELGRSWRQNPPALPPLLKADGLAGYHAGPHVTLIDPNALTDPLLARLPVTGAWRIGHFTRDVPAGYLEARATGDTSKMKPALAIYYGQMRLLTSAPLWDAQRLRAIRDFQRGAIQPPAFTRP